MVEIQIVRYYNIMPKFKVDINKETGQVLNVTIIGENVHFL